MMKKTKLAVLMSTLVWGAAVGTTSTALAAADQPVARALAGQSGYFAADFYSQSPVAELLAKHGADDPRPPKCDDHGTDLCNTGTTTIAKHGADDPRPPKCDDHGTDLCKSEA